MRYEPILVRRRMSPAFKHQELAEDRETGILRRGISSLQER